VRNSGGQSEILRSKCKPSNKAPDPAQALVFTLLFALFRTLLLPEEKLDSCQPWLIDAASASTFRFLGPVEAASGERDLELPHPFGVDQWRGSLSQHGPLPSFQEVSVRLEQSKPSARTWQNCWSHGSSSHVLFQDHELASGTRPKVLRQILRRKVLGKD
jgi:hypothetical protein